MKTKIEKEAELATYLEMKEKVAELTKRLEESRARIMKQIGAGQVGPFLVLIESQERESFSWKDAKSELTEVIVQKLIPFLKKTQYDTLKVSRIS